LVIRPSCFDWAQNEDLTLSLSKDEVLDRTVRRLNPAHAEIFDLEEVIDAVFRAFAADAGFLDATEGRDLGRDDAGVDADNAVFEGVGDAPDPADVAAVEIGG
jgi:hypothetical protein